MSDFEKPSLLKETKGYNSTDTAMPEEIWVSRHTNGDLFAVDDNNYETSYTRKDPDTITISRSELEGMRIQDVFFNTTEATANNKVIDELLRR